MTAAVDALAALAEAVDRHDPDAIAALYAPGSRCAPPSPTTGWP
jgi:hypothetical protein